MRWGKFAKLWQLLFFQKNWPISKSELNIKRELLHVSGQAPATQHKSKPAHKRQTKSHGEGAHKGAPLCTTRQWMIKTPRYMNRRITLYLIHVGYVPTGQIKKNADVKPQHQVPGLVCIGCQVSRLLVQVSGSHQSPTHWPGTQVSTSYQGTPTLISHIKSPRRCYKAQTRTKC